MITMNRWLFILLVQVEDSVPVGSCAGTGACIEPEVNLKCPSDAVCHDFDGGSLTGLEFAG